MDLMTGSTKVFVNNLRRLLARDSGARVGGAIGELLRSDHEFGFQSFNELAVVDDGVYFDCRLGASVRSELDTVLHGVFKVSRAATDLELVLEFESDRRPRNLDVAPDGTLSARVEVYEDYT